MPGAHLNFHVYQCYERIGGCDLWMASWEEGHNAQWWVGFHTPQPIWQWWEPATWSIIGWELWTKAPNEEAKLLEDWIVQPLYPGTPTRMLWRKFAGDGSTSNCALIEDPWWWTYDVNQEYVKGSVKGNAKGASKGASSKGGKGTQGEETPKETVEDEETKGGKGTQGEETPKEEDVEDEETEGGKGTEGEETPKEGDGEDEETKVGKGTEGEETPKEGDGEDEETKGGKGTEDEETPAKGDA